MEIECDYVIPKRSYIYQASKEVKRVKDSGAEREKIDSPSNERSAGNRKGLFSGKADNDTFDCVLDIMFPIEDHMLGPKRHSAKCAQDISQFKLFNLVPEGDDSLNVERENVAPTWKSLGAKSDFCHLNIDVNKSTSSTMTRLDPHGKIQDVPMKLKSHCHSSLVRNKIIDSTNTGVSDIRQNMPQQSFNFGKTEQIIECNTTNLIKQTKDDPSSSRVHHKGILKQETRSDGSFFEFCTLDQGDVLSAETYRSDNAVDWIYTFHSIKRKYNSGIWSIKDRYKKSSILVGQMSVSSQLCTETTSDGYLNNFMRLEFVLYDIDQTRSKVSSNENAVQQVKISSKLQGVRKADSSVYPENFKKASPNLPFNNGLYVSRTEEKNDPFSSLEIAAIVMQVPVESNYLGWGKNNSFLSPGSPQSAPEYADKTVKQTHTHSININVIAPVGHHGMPHTEGGPSPLIERWRSGGQCDCGGWDVGCPVLILENNGKEDDNDPNACFNHSIKLYLQGSKDRMPALKVTSQAEGEYLVEFHSQFSAIQSFAISVAVLHFHERNISILQSNVLKSLLEDELSHLLNIAAANAMKEQDVMRFRKPVPARYILDPPFSPIRRA